LIEVIAIPEKVTIENAVTILNDYDIIVDGSDNFATRYLVNDTCESRQNIDLWKYFRF
jgi:adenylyltransferase/sulfurtransferase